MGCAMGIFKRKPHDSRSLEEIIERKSDCELEEVENETNVGEEHLESKSKEEYDETCESMEQSALKCFGWKDVPTEKWLVKCVKVWYCVISFIWFLFGSLTFAPIIFISKKLRPLIKDSLKSLIIATFIYAIVFALIIILLFTGNADKANTVV
jgi:hypothetical protein